MYASPILVFDVRRTSVAEWQVRSTRGEGNKAGALFPYGLD